MGRQYQCTKPNYGPDYIPTYAEYSSIVNNTCSSEKGAIDLNTTCAKLPSFNNNALVVGYYGQTSCFTTSPSPSPGYLYANVWTDEACNATDAGSITHQVGYITNTCITQYNNVGKAISSIYVFCNETFFDFQN